MEEDKKVIISISIPKELPLEKMKVLGLALIKAARKIVGEKDPDVYYKELRYEVYMSLDVRKYLFATRMASLIRAETQ